MHTQSSNQLRGIKDCYKNILKTGVNTIITRSGILPDVYRYVYYARCNRIHENTIISIMECHNFTKGEYKATSNFDVVNRILLTFDIVSRCDTFIFIAFFGNILKYALSQQESEKTTPSTEVSSSWLMESL